MAISEKDRRIIRDLAKRAAEIAADPVQEKTAGLWRRLNRLERVRPLILLYDGTYHENKGDVTLEAEGEFARGQEFQLRRRIYTWEHMRGDHVWDDVVHSPTVFSVTGWGIEQKAARPNHVFGARHFETVIADDDPPTRVPMPTVTVNWEETERKRQEFCELYDGILKVERRAVGGHWFAPLDGFITLRGIEQTFMDMSDRPEWLHAWMDRLTTFSLSQLDQYEKLGLLSLNNGNHGVGSGGIGFTDELPQPDFDGVHVRAIDQWGHATTQIFSEVSPVMHEEFALLYEKHFLARFGLACYGCCEPLDLKVDLVLRHIPNVRRISMSPKANVARGAEALGKRAIFSHKPNPAILGMERWDADLARRELRDVFEKTKGCVVEVVMKDLHTCRGEPRRMWEWVDLAKKLSEEYA